MRKILITMVMLSVATMVATAQFQRPGQTDNQVFQSQQVMQPGVYEGRVYEPFSNVTPSEESVVGSSYSPARSRRTEGDSDPWGQNQDAGHTEDKSSPLGDGLFPLTLLALAFSAFLYLRRRKACE